MAAIDFRSPMRKTGASEQIASRTLIMPMDFPGDLQTPQNAKALVLLVHASASARSDPRNRVVAQALNQGGLATLLFDLVTPAEEEEGHVVFDVGRLAERLCAAVQWIVADPELGRFSLGVLAANTGAAAAMIAAARLGKQVGALVTRGGQPNLAGAHLDAIAAPTLLIVGSRDLAVIAANQRALARLQGPRAIEIIPDAGHFFTEPGALTAVTEHAAYWFTQHLPEGGGEPLTLARQHHRAYPSAHCAYHAVR